MKHRARNLQPNPQITLSSYLKSASADTRHELYSVFESLETPISWSIGSLLRDPNPSDEIMAHVKCAYEKLHNKDLDWIEGALGFFLFTRTAEEKEAATSNLYLENDTVQSFAIEEYGITSDLPSTWLLHRVGTTSYIIRASNGEPLALKLIKPKYFDRRDIASDTLAYKNIFSAYQGASPTVHDCGRRYVIMDFIEGQTLGSYLSTAISALKGKSRLIVTRNIVGRLCNVLHNFHVHNIKHLDLSPDNIILVETEHLSTLQPPSDFIRLIDFGPNHILREGIGTAINFEEIRSYVAPEVISDYRCGTYLSDAYSLGRIFLQLLVGEERRSDVSHLLDRAWERYPQLASLAEELIDENPSNRLIGDVRDHSALAVLNQRIEMELELQENITEVVGKTGPFQTIIGILTSAPDLLSEMGKTIRALKTHEEDERRTDLVRLKNFCLLNGLSSIAVICTFCFVAFMFDDWSASRQYLFGIASLDKWSYIPGLVVGLSFSTLASLYYLKLFARISTRACDIYRPLAFQARWTDRWMRINAISCAVLTIAGMLISSRYWPIYCGIGVIIVGINNYSAFKLSKTAKEQIDGVLRLPPSIEPDHFLAEFAGWSKGMWLYAAVLFIVCWLLIDSKATPRDQWMFAISVIILNWNIMTRNCIRRSALVGGGMLRLIQGMGRVAKIKELESA